VVLARLRDAGIRSDERTRVDFGSRSSDESVGDEPAAETRRTARIVRSRPLRELTRPS
jgi:hypothetical protein